MTTADCFGEQIDMDIAKLKAKEITFFYSTWQVYFASAWNYDSKGINHMIAERPFSYSESLIKAIRSN